CTRFRSRPTRWAAAIWSRSASTWTRRSSPRWSRPRRARTRASWAYACFTPLSSRTTEFRLLTAAIFAAALVPRLVHRGMFLDGVTYAAIARNLAEGRGRFWEPFYTATIYPAFHEHPPLAFWLQSLWFRVLGDHWYVERLYCLAAAMLIAALIAVTWRAIYADAAAEYGERRDQEWLPIALWMVVPVASR